MELIIEASWLITKQMMLMLFIAQRISLIKERSKIINSMVKASKRGKIIVILENL